MAFVDEIRLHLSAGKGGDGVIRFKREKGRPLMGPSGGDGGRGGDVYAVATRNVHTLMRYTHQKEIKAGDGGGGAKESRHGRDGEDLVLDFPLGTVLHNQSTGQSHSLDREGDRFEILKGGRGGFGNEHFKSSTNRSPKETTEGKLGESADFYIELELFADLGLIGFPNAGKSSLLNALTSAKARVADYPFTTLEPNLGDMHGYILADIPGLIEGASKGKGLGHKFLRHIKRTKMLAHLISFENEDIVSSYKAVRGELEKYDKSLITKPEVIILTKTDLVDKTKRLKTTTQTKKFSKNVFTVSLFDDESVKVLEDNLIKILRKL